MVDNYRQLSQNVETSSKDLLRRYLPDLALPEGAALQFEGTANRDSFPYVKTYGLGEMSNLRTVVRRTLRFDIPQRFASD